MKSFIAALPELDYIHLTKQLSVKKMTLIALLAMEMLTSKAQRAIVENGIAKYKGKSYLVGDTITLGNGSRTDGEFVYIQTGSRLTGLDGLYDLEKDWANWNAVIENITIRGQAVYLRAKLIDKTGKTVGGNKLFIGLEASIDHKELKE